MKKMLILAIAVALCSCGGGTTKKTAALAADETTSVDMHNAENSIDYIGTYTGVIPAADCPGIRIKLTLRDNGQFQLEQKFIGRDTENKDSGTYVVSGNTITLKGKGADSYYKIEEGGLQMLGGDKQEITGELAEHYSLIKVD